MFRKDDQQPVLVGLQHAGAFAAHRHDVFQRLGGEIPAQDGDQVARITVFGIHGHQADIRHAGHVGVLLAPCQQEQRDEDMEYLFHTSQFHTSQSGFHES